MVSQKNKTNKNKTKNKKQRDCIVHDTGVQPECHSLGFAHWGKHECRVAGRTWFSLLDLQDFNIGARPCLETRALPPKSVQGLFCRPGSRGSCGFTVLLWGLPSLGEPRGHLRGCRGATNDGEIVCITFSHFIEAEPYTVVCFPERLLSLSVMGLLFISVVVWVSDSGLFVCCVFIFFALFFICFKNVSKHPIVLHKPEKHRVLQAKKERRGFGMAEQPPAPMGRWLCALFCCLQCPLHIPVLGTLLLGNTYVQ